MKDIIVKLTERDGDVLADIYAHRFLTIPQIQRLHFQSMQTAFRRMRLLKVAGYVDSFSVVNVPDSIFRLSAKGLRLVAEVLGVERDDLKWNDPLTKPRDHYFMRHFLAINDFRITLSLACKGQSVKLLGFIPDYLGERTDKGGIVKYVKDKICSVDAHRSDISHTPDGVFALEKDGKAALFFLEIDRGTETVSDADRGVLKAVRFYVSYLAEGKYLRYAKDFRVEGFKGFRTLFVTSSKSRIVNIREAAAGLMVPPKALQFQWITIGDEIDSKGIFACRWLSLESGSYATYQIAK